MCSCRRLLLERRTEQKKWGNSKQNPITKNSEKLAFSKIRYFLFLRFREMEKFVFCGVQSSSFFSEMAAEIAVAVGYIRASKDLVGAAIAKFVSEIRSITQEKTLQSQPQRHPSAAIGSIEWETFATGRRCVDITGYRCLYRWQWLFFIFIFIFEFDFCFFGCGRREIELFRR